MVDNVYNLIVPYSMLLLFSDKGGRWVGGGGGVRLNFPNSQKGAWPDRTSIFVGGLLGKTGVTYFRVRGYTFYIRNKPKS